LVIYDCVDDTTPVLSTTTVHPVPTTTLSPADLEALKNLEIKRQEALKRKTGLNYLTY